MATTERKTTNLADYPRPSVAVDTAVLTVADRQLCVGVLRDPRSSLLRLPGTFLHEGETLADAVRRSLREKADIEGVEPTQLQVFDKPGRDSRGWVLSVAHAVVVPTDALGTLKSIPINDARGLDFDHDEIVGLAVARLRREYLERPDPHRILAEEFSMTDLRQVHELIHEVPLQPDTFRRQMIPFLRETGRARRGSVGKPAALYRRA